ncbi:MAG: 2-hydroxyacyl-CoA dehydratase [Halanaerobiales bacterium]|nr:2-hydroxyacyl-CoA dehydratase [Halanaerobiales bacterium]
MKRIGITTTVPVEIIYASGNTPVDLNNQFISSSHPLNLIEKAEQRGFPRNSCAWIKGIYSAALESKVDHVIGVSEGDCSNTTALLEVLKRDGVEVFEFRFPHDKDREVLAKNIDKLSSYLGTSKEKIDFIRKDLNRIRGKLAKLDKLTILGQATGFENHLWQVSASDFNGDFLRFERELDDLLDKIEMRPYMERKIRLGYIGVPPIIGDLYNQIDKFGGIVVFNEVQRQFTLADGINLDLIDAYLKYTYPYTLEFRLNDIINQINLRKLDGLVHYTQAFCYRAIEDMVIRKVVNIPVLKLEGDQPGNLDGRNKLRLEAFIDMLKDLRRNL